MSEILYMYNMDAYIGYLTCSDTELIFTREDTIHCWRVETIINRYKLNQNNSNLYQELVTDRAYSGG